MARENLPNRPSVFLMTNTFETGGSERQFAALAKAMRRTAAYRVELGCVWRTGAFQEGLGEVAEFSPWGSLYGRHSLRQRWRLARRLRDHRIDIAHAFDFYSNLMLIPAARLARASVVIGSQRQLGDLLGSARAAAQHLFFRLSDCVVCNSEAAAGRLVQQGLPEKKVEVIPNGLPEEAFRQAEPAFPRLPGTLRIGMVARMNNPVKNYPGLLRAAARLAPRFPGLEFFLVGDGPLRPELERLAQSLGLERQVRFVGERRDIPEVLASFDISVLPSFSESLSNAILESMAAGLPVVATSVGGNCDLVREGETGFLVPPNDEAGLAGALERLLLRPDLRAEFGRRARQTALERFSMESVLGQYERLYSRLLSSRRSRPNLFTARGAVRGEHGARLRVAMVAPSSRYVGGQSAQASLLMRQWKDDPEIEIRFIPVDPDFPRVLAWAGRVPYFRTLARTPLYLAALWRGLKGADAAHIFSASYWSFLLAPFPALIVARLRGAKALINYHSGEARDHLSRWRTALPVLRRFDRIVAPSNYLVDVFHDFGLEAQAVPNVIDENQFRYRLRQPLEPRLVCTRGFGAYYSVDQVVRAFAQVQQESPQASLSLAGTGPEEPRIRRLVEELKLSGVEFLGAVPHEKMGACYDQADIFINASWLDNMPLSILEAFSSGTPVVTTAPEGIRYLVQHEYNGLLCDPGDWQSLARNVLRLLKEPELASRLARNAFLESEKYQWKAVRSQWLEVYRNLLNPGEAAAKLKGLASGEERGRVHPDFTRVHHE